MNRRLPALLVFLSVLAALIIAACVARKSRSYPDDRLLKPFRSESPLTINDYHSLALYFIEGFEHNKTAGGGGASYPGLPSEHGALVDRLEGFSRIAPLWGVVAISGIESGQSAGEPTHAVASFRRGLLAGTDPRSREYWGAIQDSDQRIVEASDIALALWLMRDSVWARFSAGEKKQVVAWLQQVNGKKIPDNNWHLFVTFVDVVLEKLASVDNHAEALRHYERVKQFYRGEGWFSDGPGDAFDYYNAWGFHYQLFWLQQVAPEWDKKFIDQARAEFVGSYRYLMTPSGIPIMGRSVCYRMAAPVPLVLDQFATKRVAAAEARRGLDATWKYFIAQGGVKDGNITQGYCGPDARILDHYSGPASCLWGLRSLIAALYLPRDSEFWRNAAGKLPVEQSDFSVQVKSISWTIRGTKQSGDVDILRWKGDKAIALQPVRDNHAAEYDAASYSSAHPFCGCK